RGTTCAGAGRCGHVCGYVLFSRCLRCLRCLRTGRGIHRRPLPHRGQPRRRCWCLCQCRCRYDLGVPLMLTRATLTATVSAALAEDAPWGDITCESFLTEDATATAVLRPRADGVLAGTEG